MDPTTDQISSDHQTGGAEPHQGDVDGTLLSHMLSMTPAQRLEYHDTVRRSLLVMRRAGRRHYGIIGYDELDPQSAPTPDGPES